MAPRTQATAAKAAVNRTSGPLKADFSKPVDFPEEAPMARGGANVTFNLFSEFKEVVPAGERRPIQLYSTGNGAYLRKRAIEGYTTAPRAGRESRIVPGVKLPDGKWTLWAVRPADAPGTSQLWAQHDPE